MNLIAQAPTTAESVQTVRMWLDYGYPIVTGVLMALVIVAVSWFASKWARRLVIRAGERGRMDMALARFLATIAQYTALATGVIAALGKVGVETTSLVAVFASAGLAVGLALQGSLANFASGVMILFFRPFELDDVIMVADHTGKVADIGLFATTLTQPDNQRIIVPNSQITNGAIVNVTTAGTRRGTVQVGVSYGTDAAKVKQVLLDAAKRCPLVHEEPAPAVAFVDLAASSLDFQVHCWTRSSDFLGMLDQLRTAIYDDLNAAGIEIPFQQVVVHRAEAA